MTRNNTEYYVFTSPNRGVEPICQCRTLRRARNILASMLGGHVEKWRAAMMDNISFNSTMEESGFQNLFLSCGKQFVPSSLTVEEQIGKNTALISETHKMMDKHPKMSNSMSIALDSAMNHQKNLIIELGRQRGIHSEQEEHLVKVLSGKVAPPGGEAVTDYYGE